MEKPRNFRACRERLSKMESTEATRKLISFLADWDRFISTRCRNLYPPESFEKAKDWFLEKSINSKNASLIHPSDSVRVWFKNFWEACFKIAKLLEKLDLQSGLDDPSDHPWDEVNKSNGKAAADIYFPNPYENGN